MIASCKRWSTLVSSAALAAGCILQSAVAQSIPQAPAGVPFVGTWSAPGQLVSSQVSPGTIRQIMHTSVSGSSARIRLSNLFGTDPLVVEDVQLALQANASAIIAGSQKQLTFGGSTSVTIAPGQEAVSDPVSFQVPSAANIALSLFLASPLSSYTGQAQGLQDTYMAAGDVSGQPTLTVTSQSGGYFFLTNLEVQNPQVAGSIVALGASITAGIGTNENQNQRWTNILSQRLAAVGLTVGVLNEGISGNATLSDGAGLSALHRFQHDVLGQPAARWVSFEDDPINDLNGGGPPSSELIAALQSMISQAHQQQLKFLCATLTPFMGSAGWTQTGETSREAYNSFVLTPGNGCDAIIDMDAATHDPSNPEMYLPAFDSGDHLHPNAAGDQAIGNAVNLSIFSQPNPLATIQPPPTCGPIIAGQGLKTSQIDVSCDGRFGLTLQGDSNLVVYLGSTSLFSSGTVNGQPAQQFNATAAEAVMQPDGNFMVYDVNGKAIWATNTSGHPGAALLMQNDGNLVLYNSSASNAMPIWASNSCCH